MPGKELRDDLSKEEIEEKKKRTIKTRMRSSKGGRRNKVKAIRKKRGQEDSRAEGRKRSRTGLVCDEDSSTHGSD